ncbi:UNVERIFIED_CONTAM: Cellulose synthase-like protein D5 [Sesamum radiatum]|uniref:Cellulose synthase-like protein D5 n=1 Tax=Sesamum radiatum TaxID=300843 RepID=A0AAW2UT13_SESRA
MAAKSPTSSPVKITVTSSGGSRSMGLTSPVPRHSVSNNPNSPSPLSGGEKRRASSSGVGDIFLSRKTAPMSSKSRGKNPNEGFIKDTIFTGGFNSATKAHVRKSSEEEPVMAKSKLICGMEGCDEKALDGKFKNYCECGFGICHDCYLDCVGNGGGHCPGCKEPYKDISDGESEEEPRSEEKDQANPLPSWGRGVKLEKNFSLVQSFKNPNHDFDHTRWLFETKGTYGYGNALWPRDGYEFGRGTERYENPPDFSDRRNKPLTRKIGISAAIISPYRLLMVLRLGVLACFLTWRILHPNHEAIWLWLMSVVCEIWFAFSWVLDQLPKLCPVKRVTDLSVLKERFESSEPNLRNPKKLSDLPGIDVFVSTADPDKEPPLVTANTILSILAVDYPVEKVACYLSDDGGSLVTFEALAEAASFARVWVPFCRKHKIEPRNPEAYFGQKRDPLKNKVRLDFVRDRRRVRENMMNSK